MTNVLVGLPTKPSKSIFRGESDIMCIPTEVKKLQCANNKPRCKNKGPMTFVRRKPVNCGKKDYIQRQNFFAPDKDVEKIAKVVPLHGGKFQKILYEDGTCTIAPKGYLFSGAKDNGAPKQGICTVFKPSFETKENGGVILH